MPTVSPLNARIFAARVLLAALVVSLGCLTTRAGAQTAGEVEFVRGVGFAHTAGQAPRTLGKGLALKQGDRLSTADGASAIIKLPDGTRMTIRPNSELILQQYQFKESAPDNNMLLQLVRGGFRAITGLISKGSPNAAKIQTPTATIGIRGTDFDARLCTSDCRSESAKIPEKARPNVVLASAKVVTVDGELNAMDGTGMRRRLVNGGSVYPGETVETGSHTKAVLAFRDNSRLTLGGTTRFKVESFVFDEKNPTEGKFLVSLLQGSMRALTGLIAKANRRNVGFSTPTATIGIRGTGLDMDCSTEGNCSFFTWLGSIEVTPAGQTALQTLQAGEGLFVSATEIRSLSAPTLDELPRPDGVSVDVRQLFSVVSGDEVQEGLFVFVRDGHIEITTIRETLHLGKGETGFADNNGNTLRPNLMPLFLEFDRTPMPDSKNPMLITVLDETGIRSSNVCR